MPLTVCFQLVENALNDFHQVAFLRHTHVLSQTNAAEFQILSYLCLYFVHDEECLSWFSSTKIINSSQFIEIKSLDELYVYNRKKTIELHSNELQAILNL